MRRWCRAGRSTRAGDPVAPTAESLVVELADVTVEIDHAIVGALRLHEGASLVASDSIIDATAATGMAHAAPDAVAPGGKISLDACTVIGRIRAAEVATITNSLLLARPAGGDIAAGGVRRSAPDRLRALQLPAVRLGRAAPLSLPA